MIQPASNLGYTQACEYATTMVIGFLDREKLLDKKGEDRVYGDGVIKTLFTNDYSMTDNTSVADKIGKFLDKEEMTPIKTRLRSLLASMYTFVGKDTMRAIFDSMCAGLAAARGSGDSSAHKSFLEAHPELIPVIIGQTTYASRLLLARRGSQMTDKGRANP